MWKRKQNEGKVLKIMYKNLRVSGNDELPLFLFPVMEEVEKIFKGVSEEALGWSTAVSLACIGGVRLAEVRGPAQGHTRPMPSPPGLGPPRAPGQSERLQSSAPTPPAAVSPLED